MCVVDMIGQRGIRAYLPMLQYNIGTVRPPNRIANRCGRKLDWTGNWLVERQARRPACGADRRRRGAGYNSTMQTDTTARSPAFDESLDAKGLNCPLPVLRTKVVLNRMQPGQILRVEATDPHATIDFQAYCARTGHEILSIVDSDGVITFIIRRAATPAII